MEIVKWIEHFSLLLLRLLDGHVTNEQHASSSESETRRQNQFHVARKSEERQCRSQELLSPDFPETSVVWNAALVAAHERPFPYSDNLTTLTFTVANDLSETQRERLTSFLSILGIDVTAITFTKVKGSI